MWFVAHRLIDVRNPLGRRVRDAFLHPPRGIPRGRVRRSHIRAAGIEWVGRTIGVSNGQPQLDDGSVLDVDTVVWCTGFDVDFRWIDLPVFGDDGYPAHSRGVVEEAPGLYFMGLPFQTSLTSALIGGVGRDAEHVAHHISRRRSPSEVTAVG
jgi:putative flavoprotein involved in K+ transport